MRADRTVIVIGAFLFVIGLAVAWNGYDYVQIERGWTLVISGTFAACTGLVLVALGLVLRELEAIASSAARATLLLANAKTENPWQFPAAPLTQEAAPADEPEPVEEFEQTAGVEAAPEAPAPSELSEARQDGPLSWMVRSKHADGPSELRMPQAETGDGWLRRPLASPLSAPVDETVTEAHEVQEFAHESAPPPEPAPEAPPEPELEPEIIHEPAPEIVYEPTPEIAHEPVLKSAHEPETAPEPETEIPSEPEPEILHEPASQEFESQEFESQEFESHEPAIQEPAIQEPAIHEPAIHEPAIHHEPANDEPAPAAEPAPESGAKPAVIGHYDAQGTHYTLYADGSIEAETPHGVYRFDSMEELKRFIEGQA